MSGHSYLMQPAKTNNRFDSQSGTIANLKRQVINLQKTVDDLTAANEALVKENINLKMQLEEIQKSSLHTLPQINNAESKSPILHSYIQLLSQNITREPNGYRYNGLEQFFTILSFIGPHYFEMMHHHMLFPSYRTTLTYKRNYLAEYGINDDLFLGDIDSVHRILTLFLPDGFPGNAVLMVDAASVTPCVRINNDGTVEGLLDCRSIEQDEAQMLINDENAFAEFIKIHYNSLIQAEFGITFAPLDPNYPQFPIGCIPATSGKATLEIVENIESLILQLNGSISIVGLGTDGDNSYHKYCKQFITCLMSEFGKVLTLRPCEIIKKFGILMHFSDPFHLVKRDRYRKVSLIEFNVSPTDMKSPRSVHDLEALGIPQYLLDDNKGRKMEDDLPKKLFSNDVIDKVIETGDFNLIISMLPSTLIMASIHQDDLDRKTTIDYLMFGASIVLLFYCSVEHIINKALEPYNTNREQYTKRLCFTKEWCEEYIFTTFCIASLLMTEENIDVGACSSHYQEHNFANVRRHSKNDDTHTMFFSSMKYILLERILMKELKMETPVPVSRSDSGRSIYGQLPVEVEEFGQYLWLAKRLWKNATSFNKTGISGTIKNTKEKMSVIELRSFLKSFTPKIKHSISTKSTGMIRTGGLANARRWNAITQVEDLITDDDDE